jgi:flagellar protein FlgJ
MDSGDVLSAALGSGIQLPTRDSAVDSRLDGALRAAESGSPSEASRQFETLFAMMLVRELRRSMPQGMFGNSAGSDVYEGWFDEHLGAALADRDALGIGSMVKVALQRTQAARDAAARAEGS